MEFRLWFTLGSLWFGHECSIIVGTWNSNAAPTERSGGRAIGGRKKTSAVAIKTDEGQKKDIRWPRGRRAAAGPVSQERHEGQKKNRRAL